MAKAHGAQFIGVRDSRNRRVPGLCVRNGRYYAQLWVNAAQFTDYLRFLAYTGAREQEALKVRWDDVDSPALVLWMAAPPRLAP